MAVLRLETLDDERLDVYARLTEAQLRNKLEPEKGVFIAESFKVIDRALAAGHLPLSMLMEPHWLEAASDVIARAEAANPELAVFVLPKDEVKRLTGFELTRGILCAMRRPPLPSVEDLLLGRAGCRPSDRCDAEPAAAAHGAFATACGLDHPARRVAVLEGIVDHTNVGAIFRSAAALGIDAVLVTPTCCDPLYRRSVRVSMGTVFQVPWTRIGESPRDWPTRGLERLRALGFKTAAMALTDDSVDMRDEALNAEEKLAIVLGTEGDGLAAKTIAECDYTVRIPMAHGVDSLNVAAASAVAFYQLCE